jgi:hypothetical protein
VQGVGGGVFGAAVQLIGVADQDDLGARSCWPRAAVAARGCPPWWLHRRRSRCADWPGAPAAAVPPAAPHSARPPAVTAPNCEPAPTRCGTARRYRRQQPGGPLWRRLQAEAVFASLAEGGCCEGTGGLWRYLPAAVVVSGVVAIIPVPHLAHAHLKDHAVVA